MAFLTYLVKYVMLYSSSTILKLSPVAVLQKFHGLAAESQLSIWVSLPNYTSISSNEYCQSVLTAVECIYYTKWLTSSAPLHLSNSLNDPWAKGVYDPAEHLLTLPSI